MAILELSNAVVGGSELGNLAKIEALTFGGNRCGMLQRKSQVVCTYCSFVGLRQGSHQNVGLDRLVRNLGLHFRLQLVCEDPHKLGGEDLVYTAVAHGRLVLTGIVAFCHIAVTGSHPVAASPILKPTALSSCSP